jgi:4-amino-4-deoxy-L-arabinose transferase-like glycosyltransferase/tetratricopeptide (TPR) repeat protein
LGRHYIRRMSGLEKSPARFDRTFLTILLVYAVVQMAYLIVYSSMPEWNQLTVDNYYHHNWARSIAGGNIFGDTTYFRAPFYVWCLATIYALLSPDIWFARLFGLLVGLGIVAMTFRLALRIFDRRCAVVAAIIVSVYPALTYFNSELLLDPLFTLLVLWSIDRFLIFDDQPKISQAVWFGVAVGIAAITRPTILMLVPIFALWQIYHSRKIFVRQWVIVLVATAAVILPITIRNIVVAGDSVLIASQGGVNFFIGNNAESDGVSAVLPEPLGWNWQMAQVRQIAERQVGQPLTPGEVSSYWSSQGWNWILARPGDATSLFMRKLSFAVSNREISNNRDMTSFFDKVPLLGINPLGFGVIFAFAVVGCLLGRNQRGAFLGLFVALFLLSVCIFFYASRFRLPTIPLIIILASHGLFTVWDAVRGGIRRMVASAGVLLCAGAISFVTWSGLPKATFSQDSMSRGLNALSQRDFHKARDIFASVVAGDSAYPDANLNLGVAYLRLKQPDLAMIAFVREARLNPNRHRAFINIASQTLLAHRFDDANNAARRAVAIAPWDPQGWIALLRVRYAGDSGNLAEITALADSAAFATQDNVMVLTETGSILSALGEYAVSETYLRRAVASSPPPVESDDKLFGQMDGSPEQVWDRNKAGAWFQLGFIAGVSQRYGDAIEFSKKAIERDSLNERAWVNLVAAYRSTGQTTIADSLIAVIARIFPQSQFLDHLR